MRKEIIKKAEELAEKINSVVYPGYATEWHKENSPVRVYCKKQRGFFEVSKDKIEYTQIHSEVIRRLREAGFELIKF